LEWCVAATGERSCDEGAATGERHRGNVVVYHRQSRNARNRIGATYEREMVQPRRQRLVDVQRHVTE
jgi:hypothetical protein